MQRLLFVLSLFIFGGAAQALVIGDAEVSVLRTWDSKSEMSQTLKVPLFRIVQEWVPVFGPHPTCGYDRVCDPQGKNCHSRMRSCMHPELRTRRVFDHNEPFNVTVTFPAEARLYFGEAEELTFYFYGDRAGVKIQKARNRYNGRLEKRASLNDRAVSVFPEFRNRQIVEPPNTVVFDWEKEIGKAPVLTLQDPALGKLDLPGSLYQFEIKQRRVLLPDPLIAQGKLALDKDHNKIRIVLDQDSPYLYDKRYFADGKEYELKIWLWRKSPLYNDRASEAVGKRFFFYEK